MYFTARRGKLLTWKSYILVNFLNHFHSNIFPKNAKIKDKVRADHTGSPTTCLLRSPLDRYNYVSDVGDHDRHRHGNHVIK